MEIPLCGDIAAKFLILSPNVPNYIYYSHAMSLITAFVVLFFILRGGKDKFLNRLLAFTLVSFISWVVLALIFWASNRGDVIMFVWSLTLLVEPLAYVGALYLLYYLAEKKDFPFSGKLVLFLAYLPLIIFVPTRLALSGFDVATCLSIEGPIALYYTYAIEGLITLAIIAYSVYRYRKPVAMSRKELLPISIGILLFLFAFAWGNIIGSFTENWQLGQFGLFGMPVFLAFLVYAIVRFKTFNIKLIGAQALVVILWIALFTLLFIRTIEVSRIIVSLTLLLFLVVGILLIRSVLREVKQREQLADMAVKLEKAYEVEKLAHDELERVDKFKDQFLMTTQHNLRTPLTSMMGYSDLLLNGTFGKQNKKTVEVITRFQGLTQGMIKMVNDFLDMAQFQMGKSVITLKPNVPVGPMLDEIMNELKFKADSRNITLTLHKPDVIPTISADREKLKAAIFNIIDNAVKYTEKGSVGVDVQVGNNVKIVVTDTGIGLPADKVKTLFDQMFQRLDSAKKMSSVGSGVGLYLSGQIITSHKGKVWAESKGEGQGSVFTVELPLGAQ